MITLENFFKKNIIQWSLNNFSVFRKKTVVSFPKHIKLLLISNEYISIHNTLISDVARSMNFVPEQLFLLMFDQILLLPKQIFCHCWWIGLKVSKNFSGINLVTPSFYKLKNSSEEKRILWKQINNYSEYLECYY